MAQNLLSSPPAAGAGGGTSTSSNNNASPQTAKQSPTQQRIAALRLKRQELEKRLQEKNSLLQELCRKEAHLIGVYPTVTVAGQEGHHNPSSSADDIGALLSGGSKGHNTHSLPRKIGTGFTLSEKYLNKRTLSSPLNAPSTSCSAAAQQQATEDEELNNLLLQRDIQQQICKASLKLLNDVALTKSVRRKHKQSYEVAQQKLLEIGQGLTTIQKKHLSQQSDERHQQQVLLGNSQTLPLSVKTNFKVPQSQQQQQPQHYSGESPVLQHQRRNRHDSYSAAQHHSPVAGASSADHKGLYRSSSNSSSLNNATILGKSSLSLDNAHQHQLHLQQLHPSHASYGQSSTSSAAATATTGGHSKPISYESKSLHNFVMSSPNHSSTSQASVASTYHSPHHHPGLLSPTFYHSPNNGYAMATTSRTANASSLSAAAGAHHYPSNSASLRQAHQHQQQFMSPPPQQVIIPQSGLGGYWTLNEHNERVWCASSLYSPEPNSGGGSGQPPGPQPGQRHAATLDRKAAIYVPNTSQSAIGHGKMKMPSPEASPLVPSSSAHHSNLQYREQQHQGHQQQAYGDMASVGYNHTNSGKSFSIPSKSTSMGNIDHIISRTVAAEDTASLGSFNSDSNNNTSVYHQQQRHHHNLVSSMAAAKISSSFYPSGNGNHHHPNVDDDDDDDEEGDAFNEDADNVNNNPPPPLRPKSSASQHASTSDRTWYETSLDKVVGGGGSSKMASRHKPPALLPRGELNHLQAPQLHIDIPTSPLGGGGQHNSNHHQHHHQALERSMSHRMMAERSSNYVSPTQPPPITRQQQHNKPQQQETLALHSPVGAGVVGMPMSPHKKLSSSASYQHNNAGNNVANNLNNNVVVRRSQSNVLASSGSQQQHQQQQPSQSASTSSSSSAALLSPRLVVNGGGQQSPVIAKSHVAVGEEEIQVESPKNMTVVQQGKFQPYKEESKPFEISDFYKYSTKFRQQTGGSIASTGTLSGSGGGSSRQRGGGTRNVDENSSRGNALYQQEQQQRVYSDLADVANNNRGSSNNHNNGNNHVSMYDRTGLASNATAATGGSGRDTYPIGYQQ